MLVRELRKQTNKKKKNSKDKIGYTGERSGDWFSNFNYSNEKQIHKTKERLEVTMYGIYTLLYFIIMFLRKFQHIEVIF